MCVYIEKGANDAQGADLGSAAETHISMSGGLCFPLVSTSGAATNKREFCVGECSTEPSKTSKDVLNSL